MSIDDAFWVHLVRRVALLERRKGVSITQPDTEDFATWLGECAKRLGVRRGDLTRPHTVRVEPAHRRPDHGELEDAIERALEVDAMDGDFARVLVNTIDDFIQAQAQEWWRGGQITASRAADLMGCSLSDARAELGIEDEG